MCVRTDPRPWVGCNTGTQLLSTVVVLFLFFLYTNGHQSCHQRVAFISFLLCCFVCLLFLLDGKLLIHFLLALLLMMLLLLLMWFFLLIAGLFCLRVVCVLLLN